MNTPSLNASIEYADARPVIIFPPLSSLTVIKITRCHIHDTEGENEVGTTPSIALWLFFQHTYAHAYSLMGTSFAGE